jgi:hypothetical protein
MLKFNHEPYFDDFLLFSRYMMEQHDYDPTYPVLRKRLDMISDHEERLWYVLIYVAFYSLANGEWFWQQTHLDPEKMLSYETHILADYPTGTTRRNLRGGINMRQHLRSLFNTRNQFGSFRNWLTRDFTNDPELNASIVQSAVREVWGNGPWAAYKIAEILEKVFNYPISFTDMGGLGGGLIADTPRKGLELFFGPLRTVDEFREAGTYIFHRQALSTDISVVETFLCEFYRCATGRCYPGYVTDIMLQGINKCRHEKVRMPLFKARLAALPPCNLGELNGWEGVDKERSLLYYFTKKIIRRTDPVPEVAGWPEDPWNVPFNWR